MIKENSSFTDERHQPKSLRRYHWGTINYKNLRLSSVWRDSDRVSKIVYISEILVGSLVDQAVVLVDGSNTFFYCFVNFSWQHQFFSVPDKQYHISIATNKVYDITERKKFCSNSCFKSSNYLKEQLLTSPLWLRDQELLPEIKLLPHKLQDVQDEEDNEVLTKLTALTLQDDSNNKDLDKS